MMYNILFIHPFKDFSCSLILKGVLFWAVYKTTRMPFGARYIPKDGLWYNLRIESFVFRTESVIVIRYGGRNSKRIDVGKHTAIDTF